MRSEEDNRHYALERLKTETFDALIIGGGINGAGLARDLALRNQHAGAQLRIALVERAHFASGTSSRNSHLIHGGLRYLKQLQLRQRVKRCENAACCWKWLRIWCGRSRS